MTTISKEYCEEFWWKISSIIEEKISYIWPCGPILMKNLCALRRTFQIHYIDSEVVLAERNNVQIMKGILQEKKSDCLFLKPFLSLSMSLSGS